MYQHKKKSALLKVKESLLANCPGLCNHTGWVDGKMCACMMEFAQYVDLDEAGIDREYWDASFDTWKGDPLAKDLVERYVKQIDVAYDEGLGFLFWGNSGTGKTMLCSIILKTAKASGRTIKFITMAELLDVLRKKISDESIEKSYIETVKEVDFLCIDNLGSEYIPQKSSNQYVIAEFDTLARYRKRNMLPTLLTTNLTPNEFSGTYGKAISSLYTGCSAIIEVSGADYRQTINRFNDFIK